MDGPSQPGWNDLTLAEFQAKLLARRNPPQVDEVEERMHRFNGLSLRWGVLVALVAGALGWWFDVNIAAIGAIVVIVIGLLLAWRSHRRAVAQVASLSDQA